MVPPEIIEYTPYSVALVVLWCAAMLTMAAKSLLSLKWKWKWKLLPCCFWSVLVLTTFLTPAEAVNANLQKDYTVLPGMKVWNGVPYHDFRRVWFAALIVALGSIFQEGWTLIQVARDQDLGGPANRGTAGQNASSNNRNMRLFHSILNYIDSSCDLYRRVWSTFNNDGRGLYNYLWVFGIWPLALHS